MTLENQEEQKKIEQNEGEKHKLYYQVVAFLISFIFIAINHGQRSVMSSNKIQMEKQKDLQIDTFFHGRADNLFMIGMALGSYPSGIIADNSDLRIYLPVVSVISAAQFSLLAYSTNTWLLVYLDNNVDHFHLLLYLQYFLSGIIYCAVYPPCSGLVLNWLDERNRGRLGTLWAGSLNVGGIIFFQLPYYVQSINLDWRFSYYISSICYLFFGMLTPLVLKPYPEEVGITIQSVEYDYDDYNEPNQPSITESQMKLTQLQKLKKLFRIKFVMVVVSIYTTSVGSASILDFWLNIYLQNQGLYVSAHKISQLYEFFSFIGGIILGLLLDKQFKQFKITTLCVLFFMSGICFAFIQYHYKKVYYFIIVSAIGLLMGAGYNYLVTITAKLLLENKQVKQCQIDISTLVGLLETSSSTFLIFSFYVIPLILDELFLFLASLMIVAGIICIPVLKDEWNYYRNMKIINREQKEKENLI